MQGKNKKYFQNIILSTGVLLVLLLAVTDPIIAVPVNIISDKNTVGELALNSEYFLDTAGTMKFEEVSSGTVKFNSYSMNSFRFGFRKGTLWIRFFIHTDRELLVKEDIFIGFDNAALASVNMYIPVVEEGRRSQKIVKGGWRNSGISSEIKFIYPAFYLPGNYDVSRPLYIEVETPYTLQFSVTLYSNQLFIKSGLILFLIVGFCTGTLISMLLYNLFLYFSVRERQYLYYVFYVTAQLIYQCSLFGLINYLFPGIRYFLFSYISILSALMMISILFFTMNFLNTSVTAPGHHRGMKILIIISIITVIMTLMSYRWIANILQYLAAQAGIVTVLTASAASIKYGFKPAKYFLAANIVFFICASLFIFRIYNIIPNNEFTMHAVFFGSAAESILLSFALGYRIKVMKVEESRLRESEKKLHVMSVTDDLTGLYNKRFFNSSIDDYIRSYMEDDVPISLLMLDVDHFKLFNDTYGHPEGDIVLANLGMIIMASLRERDLPSRYGGEEFAVILHNADAAVAMITAERIRSRFEEKTVQPLPGIKVSVTVSIGVSQYRTGETKEELIRRCDQALYEAKNSGRNRIVMV